MRASRTTWNIGFFNTRQSLSTDSQKKYNLHRLVYFEAFGNIRDAIAREKQIKGWLRAKKVALIKSANPDWKDLSADWMKKLQPPSRCHPEANR